MQLMAAELEQVKQNNIGMSFSAAAAKFFEVKKNILSPTTIRGYQSILRNLPDSFTAMRLSDISRLEVQAVINDYGRTHSPKSTINANGFILSVITLFYPDVRINTTLPQKVKTEPYIPTDSDVKRILEYSKDSPFEIPLILATFGLRRSEICALSLDDLDGNKLNISKALVQDDAGEWVIKTTKTEAGTRVIYLPDTVVDLIRQKGYIYNGYPNSIVCYLTKVQKKLGIPHFSLHKLRHYYASMAHALGIPDSYIMASGGWKSDNVLKSVYRHALSDRTEEMQKQAAQHITDLLPNV